MRTLSVTQRIEQLGLIHNFMDIVVSKAVVAVFQHIHSPVVAVF